jgi:hypothetical protein
MAESVVPFLVVSNFQGHPYYLSTDVFPRSVLNSHFCPAEFQDIQPIHAPVHLQEDIMFQRKRFFAGFVALFAVALPLLATDQTLTFRIPPVKIPLNVKDQQVTIAASAFITLLTKDHGLNILKLQLSADLSGLQENLTGILAAELNKDDQCGDRIAIQHATLTPAEPSANAVVQLHYERWACAKIFGKQQSKRLVGGNAVMQLKLTPAVEQDNTELRLIPEVGPIQADGSLGELLRSGTPGDMIQEKIRKSILNALQKGTDLSATLPPAAQGNVTVQNAEFKDGGAGRLLVLLAGEIRATNEQIQALSKQVQGRIAAR